MDRKQFLSQQDMFKKEHDIGEEIQRVLEEYELRTARPPTLHPMLVEDAADRMIITPLGVIALASGGKIARTANPKTFSIDGGVVIPGPSFTERLGWHPAVPFSFHELEHYSMEPDAELFVSQYRACRGPVWDGWTSVAHLGLVDLQSPAITSLMAACPRSMYDNYFQPPRFFSKELKHLAQLDKIEARTQSAPDDWMHPAARRMMRFFRGD